MSDPKCVCSMGYENSCRIHNEKSKAAYEWANGYFIDNVDVLGLELFHREMLEVAHKAGQSDHDLAIRKLKREVERLEAELADKVLANHFLSGAHERITGSNWKVAARALARIREISQQALKDAAFLPDKSLAQIVLEKYK